MAGGNYSADDVTLALMRVARNGGDVDLTAEELIDDRFQVPAATLQLWISETHATQYRRIAKELGSQQEDNAIARLRTLIEKTSQLRLDMVEDVGKITDDRLKPQALRALSDAEAKSTTMLLQLTGRPTNGDRSSQSIVALAEQMVESGLVRLAPGLSLQPTLPAPADADGTVEEGR